MEIEALADTARKPVVAIVMKSAFFVDWICLVWS
jgi:hypothetical protein